MKTKELKETEEVVNKQEVVQPQTKSSILNALDAEFATTVNRIYINSLKREVDFREITVAEQKTLSRIIADNKAKNRQDIVTEALVATLQKICLDDTVVISDLLEFDRLKLIMSLFQFNVSKDQVIFTCEKCGTENAHTLDLNRVMEKLKDIQLDDREFVYENNKYTYNFTLEYPSIKKAIAFYKVYQKKHPESGRENASQEDMAQRELNYSFLYIKKLEMINKATKNTIVINFDEQLVENIEDIMAKFPIDVIGSENGVIRYIGEQMVSIIDDAFNKVECYQCRQVYSSMNGESFLDSTRIRA